MNLNDKFKLFGNCIPVKGYFQDIICDLQNNDFVIINNELYDILTLHSNKTVKRLIIVYGFERIKEYFYSLIDMNLGFFTSISEMFPVIDLSFNDCFLVSNAVIDYDRESYSLNEVIKQLDYLNCKNIELRLYNKEIGIATSILKYINKYEMMISSFGIIIEYSTILTQEYLIKFVEQFNRISYIIIYNAPQNILIPSEKSNGMGYLVFMKGDFKSNKCGIISTDYFVTNIKVFTESLHHNSCLHKKISIDVDGNIKNCPSMPQNFGNIKDTTLEESLNHKDFKKYWNLTKDSIEVCKDCEFRYICTDCRAYTERTHENADGLDTSKPLKCGYNPYTGEWEEWSINPLKQKAINQYGL